MADYINEFLVYGRNYKNVLSSDFWIIDIEKAFFQGRFYLKVYIAGIRKDVKGLNQIDFLIHFNDEQFEQPIYDFSITDKYPNKNVVGCVVPLPESYNSETYELRIIKIIHDLTTFDFKDLVVEYFEPSKDQISNSMNDYLKLNKIGYSVFPNFGTNYWQCLCENINNISDLQCSNCKLNQEDIKEIYSKGIIDLFWDEYSSRNLLEFNESEEFDSQLNEYVMKATIVSGSRINKAFIESKFDLVILKEEHQKRREKYLQEKEEIKRKNELESKKRNRIFLIATILILFSVFMYAVGINLIKYGYAHYEYNNENYEKAHEIFLSLEDFMDSETLAMDSEYNYALVLFNEDPVKSISILENLLESSYNAAREKYEDFVYTYAVRQLNDLNYEESIHYFEKCLDYKDSKELYLQVHYDYATYLYGLGEPSYETAFNFMSVAAKSSFKDANDVLNKWRYDYAKSFAKNKDYENAIKFISQVGSYKDSKTLLKEYKYQLGKTQLSTKKYESALATFESIKGYRDADTQAKEAKYQISLNYLSYGDYQSAWKSFNTLKGYRNSTAKLYEIEDIIYPWKVVGFAVSDYDDTYPANNGYSFSVYDTYYITFKIQGGPPAGNTEVKITWCHGNCSSWTYSGYANGYTFSTGYYWTNPNWYTPDGYYTFYVYLKVHGEWRYMDEETIYVY